MNIEDLPVVPYMSAIGRSFHGTQLWKGYLKVTTPDGEEYHGMVGHGAPIIEMNAPSVDVDDDASTPVEERINAVITLAHKIEQRNIDLLEMFKMFMPVHTEDVNVFLEGIDDVEWVDDYCWYNGAKHDGNACTPLTGYCKDLTSATCRVMDISFKLRKEANEFHL